MSIVHKTGGLSGLVTRLGRQNSRSGDEPSRVAEASSVVVEPRTVAATSAETVYASKTLARFLDLLFARPNDAEVMDLGPVIGSNITFLGERVGCKIHVEDIYADIDRHIHQDRVAQLPEFLTGRLRVRPSSIDAVLGWDVFDYLPPMAATTLASELMRILRPGGVFLGFFGARASDDPRYTKFFFEDESHLRCRYYPSACTRRWVLQNRDINIMFAGLEVFETVLLKSGVREILFRKRILS
ncbi:MAG TPA: class I SAM-dependent methyltransferase [Methylomirabilota bacterium]|nr:class I SAM-dependent methyltransferase [Methylomirabilota bacterium]